MSRSNPCLPRPCRTHPCLTFAPLAWLKLQYFCHAGGTEVGGFGIAAEDDLLYVEDFVTVRQEATPLSVRFLDEAVADFFDGCVDAGLKPQRFSRLWCHTHPADSVTPSATDEETFARSFGGCDWAVMFILGRTGRTYARLTFRAGPGGDLLLPTRVDWSTWPCWLDGTPGTLDEHFARWRDEYVAHVQALPTSLRPLPPELLDAYAEDPTWWDGLPYGHELDEAAFAPAKGNAPQESIHEPHPF